MMIRPTTLRGALELLAANFRAVAAHAYFGSELRRLLQHTADESLEQEAAALAEKWSTGDGVCPEVGHFSRHFASDVQRAITNTRRRRTPAGGKS
jgi:hypothetical protein